MERLALLLDRHCVVTVTTAGADDDIATRAVAGAPAASPSTVHPEARVRVPFS